MALGAGGREVRRLMLVQGLRPVAIGVLFGLAGSIALSRVASAFLWGVSPTDPATLGVVALILLCVALAATWLPARDAARLSPVEALAE